MAARTPVEQVDEATSRPIPSWQAGAVGAERERVIAETLSLVGRQAGAA